ncbi:MAG: NAD(P)/FAD-dependent oxidoreductase, partial [Thermomicrobiales bacterium]
PVADGDLEYFYHHLFQSDHAIIDLIDELGIGDRLVWLPSNVGYFADGKIWPLNGAADLLKLGFIPFHDRVRLGLVTAYLQRVRDWKPFEQVTAHEWLQRALGKNAYDRTLGAQLRAKFGRYHDQVAMVWFWGKIWLRTTSRRSPLDQEKLGYPMGSFNVVIDALAAAATRAGGSIHAGIGPEHISRAADGRWQVDLPGGVETCDLIVATGPSPVFSRMVPELPDDYAKRLDSLTYEAAVVALLELDQPLSDIYWLNMDDPEMTFTGVIEHTNFIDPSHYGGKRYVYLSKYLEPEDPYYTMSDDELIERYAPFLRRINPAFDASWITRSWVFRERAAQPIVPLRYSEKMPPHRTGLPGLYLANTTQIYPEDRGTNYSVRLGNDIATLVLEDIAAGKARRPS